MREDMYRCAQCHWLSEIPRSETEQLLCARLEELLAELEAKLGVSQRHGETLENQVAELQAEVEMQADGIRLLQDEERDYQARIAELETMVADWKGKADLYRRHSSPTADAEWEAMEARIAELEAEIAKYESDFS